MHFEALGRRNPPVHGAHDGDLQIDDCAALFADEVVVFADIRVQAVEGAAKGDSPDQALVDKDPDVSVDGSQAEAGELLLQLSKKPVCAGMGVR